MIPHIEYHCDTEGCNARLSDIVSEQGVIEVKCPKCKQTIQVDVEELYETIRLYQKFKENRRSKKELRKLPYTGQWEQEISTALEPGEAKPSS